MVGVGILISFWVSADFQGLLLLLRFREGKPKLNQWLEDESISSFGATGLLSSALDFFQEPIEK